jgi:hypothetical protein
VNEPSTARLVAMVCLWPCAGAFVAAAAAAGLLRPLLHSMPSWTLDIMVVLAGAIGLLAGGVAGARRLTRRPAPKVAPLASTETPA